MKRIYIVLVGLSLNACTMFGGQSYEYSNPSAYEVASHNYNTAIGSASYGRMYLLVNDKGQAKPRDLALYINSLLEPLGDNKLTLQSIIEYNQEVIEHLKKD